jgi:ElaB/YqjD/DUF883 family membrane-anchored ribosome-binding protein
MDNASTMSGNNSPTGNSTPMGDNSKRVAGTADRAHEAVDRAADKAAPMLERASTVAHKTIDKVASAAMPAAEWASESTRQLATRSSEFADEASNFVRARPLATVAGALAIGYLLGKISR